jgi:hypothetical protein
MIPANKLDQRHTVHRKKIDPARPNKPLKDNLTRKETFRTTSRHSKPQPHQKTNRKTKNHPKTTLHIPRGPAAKNTEPALHS